MWKNIMNVRRLPKKSLLGSIFYLNLGHSCESVRIAVFSTESESTGPYLANKKNPEWFDFFLMTNDAF